MASLDGELDTKQMRPSFDITVDSYDTASEKSSRAISTRKDPLDGTVSEGTVTSRRMGAIGIKDAIESSKDRRQSVTTAGTGGTTAQSGSLSDFRLDLLTSGKYRINSVFLNFVEPDVERGYCSFMYTNSGFYGGKMWHLIAIVLTFLSLLFYHPDGKWLGSDPSLLSHYAWIGMDISFLSTILMMVCLFVPKLYPFREYLFIAALVLHWPAYLTMTLEGKDPHTLSYAIPLGCFFFCTFITFARFRLVIFFLSVTPIISLFTVTFGCSSYWDHHSYFEMFLWPMNIPCILTMRAFEARCRLCYAEVCVANDNMEVTDEKSQLTQQMVANFFPATVAADLLCHRELFTSRQYTETVLIQSDLEGFTAHSAVTDPSAVVDMLSKMFERIDALAPIHGVEKMATVGDAYLGACFPTHQICVGLSPDDNLDEVEMQPQGGDDPMASAVPLAMRCSGMIAFGSKFITSVPQLRMRVAVCHGTVTVGFVGEYPPKMDAFGPPVREVGDLERFGTPGFIHVASNTMELALKVGATTSDGPSSAFGVLVPGWIEDEPPQFIEHVESLRNYIDDNADRIMKHLSKFGDELRDLNVAKRPRGGFNDEQTFVEVDPLNGSVGSDGAPSHGGVGSEYLVNADTTSVETFQTHKRSIYSSQGGADGNDDNASVYSKRQATEALSTNDEGGTMFHPMLLRFREPRVEAKFRAFLADSSIIFISQQLLMVLQMLIATASLGFICVDVPGNRLIVVFTMITIMLLGGYLRFIGTGHRFNTACIWVFYGTMCFMSSMLSSECDAEGSMKGYYAGVTWSLFAITFVTAPYFCLDMRVYFRIALIAFSCALCLAMVPVHERVVGRKDVHYDWFIVLLLVSACGVTFFLDYNLRSSFAACVRVRRNVIKSRRRHARTAKKCIDTMLPRFVSNEIIKPADTEEGKEEDAKEGGVEISTDGMLWEYPRAVAMFISFARTDGKESSVEGVDATVKAVEVIIAREGGVQKVKSIQNTILLVGGIVKNSNPQTCALRMLTVGLEVINILSIDGLDVRCGLHTGPCFGAVIGTTGLSFDVFGDTINTASRMQSHAAANAAHFSMAFKDLLGTYADEHFTVTSCGAINVKGKGMMMIFRGAVPEEEEAVPEKETVDEGDAYPGFVDDGDYMI